MAFFKEHESESKHSDLPSPHSNRFMIGSSVHSGFRWRWKSGKLTHDFCLFVWLVGWLFGCLVVRLFGCLFVKGAVIEQLFGMQKSKGTGLPSNNIVKIVKVNSNDGTHLTEALSILLDFLSVPF